MGKSKNKGNKEVKVVTEDAEPAATVITKAEQDAASSFSFVHHGKDKHGKVVDETLTVSDLSKLAKQLHTKALQLQQAGASFGDKMLSMRAACSTLGQFQTLCSHIELHNNWGRKTRNSPKNIAAPQVWKDYKNIVIQLEEKHKIPAVGKTHQVLNVDGEPKEFDIELNTISAVKTLKNRLDKESKAVVIVDEKESKPLLLVIDNINNIYTELSPALQEQYIIDLQALNTTYEALAKPEQASIAASKANIAQGEQQMHNAGAS